MLSVCFCPFGVNSVSQNKLICANLFNLCHLCAKIIKNTDNTDKTDKSVQICLICVICVPKKSLLYPFGNLARVRFIFIVVDSHEENFAFIIVEWAEILFVFDLLERFTR